MAVKDGRVLIVTRKEMLKEMDWVDMAAALQMAREKGKWQP